MKVLVLHSELGVLRGGGENFTRNLFTAFARRGHRVAAAFVANHFGRYAIPLPEAIEPIPIRGWWSRTFGQQALRSIGGRLSLKNGLRTKWDHVQDAVDWRTVRWHHERFRRSVARRFAGRWRDFDVVYVHGDPLLAGDVAQHRPTVLRMLGPVEEQFVTAVRGVHAVCANGDALRHIRQVLGERVLDLPIGLDEQIFLPGPSDIRSRLGWNESHRVAGYVGRLTRFKGVDLLGAAFDEVSRRIPDARLLVVGSGDEEKHLRSTLARQIREGVVHIERDVGHDRLSDWYRALDVLVMPSRYENFSNAAIEAMACGVPVLASNVGGNPMLAANGGAWLFEAASAEALTGSLAEVLANRSEMQARGRNAAGSVRGNYSWAQTAQRLEEIIQSELRAER